MPSLAEKKAQVNADIQEIRKKIQLSEGQSKAFYEEAENEKKNNRNKINQLRSQIKLLHVKFHEAKQGSEKAAEEAILSRRKRRSISTPSSARSLKSDQVIKLSEYRLHDYVKRLNFLQHNFQQKDGRLHYLKRQLEEAGPERAKEEQKLIDYMKQEHVRLQNELDRILVQVQESDSVKRRYSDMIMSLRGCAATHGTFIDVLQSNVAQEKDTLNGLKESRWNAERTRDDLRTLLHQEEDCAFEARRERERRLDEFRKKAEERGTTESREATDRKLSLLRTPTQRYSPTPGHQRIEPPELINHEIERFLHLFSKLKEVLGVTTSEEVIDRLKSQKATREHLHLLREATLQELKNLKQEKESLQQELHRVKYAATEDSAKLDGAFGELETTKSNLIQQKIELEETLEEAMKILASARATLEQMMELLKTENDDTVFEKREEISIEGILQIKDLCLSRAKHCLKNIADLEEESENTEKEMILLEGGRDLEKIPIATFENVRVPFHPVKENKPTVHQGDDGGDSDDEEEALARRFIKRQAQMIVETKSRKRNRPVSTFRS